MSLVRSLNTANPVFRDKNPDTSPRPCENFTRPLQGNVADPFDGQGIFVISVHVNLPKILDPLSVTGVSLNYYYFGSDDDMDTAERLIAKLFPNAELLWYLFHEDLSSGLLAIEPQPDWSDEERELVYKAVEDRLPQGPHRGDPRYNEANYTDGIFQGSESPSVEASPQMPPIPGWKPGNPEAWKE